MDNSQSSLTSLLEGRPKWLQHAATLLIQQSELTDQDISMLASLCLQEAEGKHPTLACPLSSSPFGAASQGVLRLCSISNIKGINALAPSKPLEFGQSNLSIVYGYNGSGKSGYVRLLKHICGARERGMLHKNVYESTCSEQTAQVTFEHNGTRKTHTWPDECSCNELSGVDIFDTSFGKVFVSREDEVSYEPPILSFLTSLIDVCERVNETLKIEADKHISQKPAISEDKKRTPEGRWYDAINPKTTNEEVAKYCIFSKDDESELQKLQTRLAEQAPAERSRQLKTQKQYAENLAQRAEKHLKQLSDNNCQQIFAAKKNLIDKKKAEEVAAGKVFADSELEGIGSDTWKVLWEAARRFSVSVAYKDNDYPRVSDGSRCVLCHQMLTPEAKDRLLTFENFIKGEMQKEAINANSEYESALKSIDALPSTDELNTNIAAIGGLSSELSDKIISFYNTLRDTKERLLEMVSTEVNADFSFTPTWIEELTARLRPPKWIQEVNALLQPPKWIEEVSAHSRDLGELALKFEEDAQKDSRAEMVERQNSLLTRKWLVENRSAIEHEKERYNRLDLIDKAKKLTNTAALSKKIGTLAEELITEALVERFNRELSGLGASRIKVELVKARTTKGKVLHKLQLRGASQGVEEVLSEGESRIISIAAFLADVTGKNCQAPFVFDDPISSLDQNYEEAVVKRLIKLSEDRQIIIFTHRLSLLGTLNHFAEKEKIKKNVIGIRSVAWGTGEPAPIPLSQSGIKSALNTLMNQRYQEAKKAHETGEFDQEETLLKSMCSEFRVLLERAIENDLLCGVVQRFQRSVSTLKLMQLSKLKREDCSFLDGLMTKYSAFEHSQSEESPVPLPTPAELLGDMTALLDWIHEYDKRNLV